MKTCTHANHWPHLYKDCCQLPNSSDSSPPFWGVHCDVIKLTWNGSDTPTYTWGWERHGTPFMICWCQHSAQRGRTSERSWSLGRVTVAIRDNDHWRELTNWVWTVQKLYIMFAVIRIDGSDMREMPERGSLDGQRGMIKKHLEM